MPQVKNLIDRLTKNNKRASRAVRILEHFFTATACGQVYVE